MTEQDVLEILQLFEKAGIDIWIDGGWGIDALIGKETRPHEDLDVAFDHRHVGTVRQLLETRGFHDMPRNDTRECNFVLGDDKDRRIDIHTFRFDEKGNNIFGVAYPKDSLAGRGMIGKKHVNCISLEWVIKFHEAYEPDENDRIDIQALCEKFGVKPPKNYVK